LSLLPLAVADKVGSTSRSYDKGFPTLISLSEDFNLLPATAMKYMWQFVSQFTFSAFFQLQPFDVEMMSSLSTIYLEVIQQYTTLQI